MKFQSIVFLFSTVLNSFDSTLEVKSYLLPVEFRNVSQKYAFVVAYNDQKYILGVRTNNTMSSINVPVLFATEKNQAVPLLAIGLFNQTNNEIGTPIKIIYSIPRISIIKVANPPDKEFVPRFLPKIYLKAYPTSSFPIQCIFDTQNQILNYVISFSEQ